MANIYIVRSTTGEMEASEMGGLKVVFAFEERRLVESYYQNMSWPSGTHKIEAIDENEFATYVVPVLRASSVQVIVFNLLPGETPGQEVYSIDISNPKNPRTFDFNSKRWLTAKESRRLRKVHRANTN